MHEPTIVLEVWTYRCATCQHVWDVAYEEWHAGDGHGGDAVHYRRRGQRCVSPWSEPECENCGGYAVKPLPSPTIAHPVRQEPPVPH
jgi:hypothetical protein